MQKKQLLNDANTAKLKRNGARDAFVAKMGGEAIRELLATEDLHALLVDLKDKLRKTKSMQARMKLAKRLKLSKVLSLPATSLTGWSCHAFRSSRRILRPLVPLDGGRFATSDLNDLYRRVINRNNRLKGYLKAQNA